MDKSQAIHQFWSSFGLPAYDENSVPDDAVMPYITYSVATGPMDSVHTIGGSLWYRSTSWRDVSKKADEIAKAVGGNGYYINKIDGGYLWITQGPSFAQRMSEPGDDMTKRIYISLNVEFLTFY